MQTAVIGARQRDVRVMGVVGLCHFFSHFYQLALPPLFVLIHQTEGYSYESLALLITVFYATSFSLQLPVGFFVDKFGARPILMAGVALLSGTTVLYGLIPGYAALVALSVLAGAANSVFHPADYSILNASVTKARLGRAFSIHNFGGFVGYATYPPFMREGASATVEHCVDTLEYLINLIGEENVGIGTDFTQEQDGEFFDWLSSDKGDGRRLIPRRPGGVTVMPEGLRTIGEFPNLTRSMEARGWPRQRIERVMGQNWRRFLGEVWKD